MRYEGINQAGDMDNPPTPNISPEDRAAPAVPRESIEISGIHWTRLYFNWRQMGCGFGELIVEQDEQGKLHCRNETMSREWVRAALIAFANKLADEAILDDDAAPGASHG